MNRIYLENWEITKKRLTLLWDNEILDRPCVSVTCPKAKTNLINDNRSRKTVSLKDNYMDPEWILESHLGNIENTYYGGDAFPVVFPYWACGGHFKYLLSKEQYDTHVEYKPGTIWMNPVIDDYENFNFTVSKENPNLQAELQALKYLVKESKGRYFVAPPDNCGSYDALAALRGNEELLMDFYDNPEKAREIGNKLVDALIVSGDEIFDIIKESNDGGSSQGWLQTWSPGRHMQLQCDLSVMISPALFEEYIMEELERTTNWLDHSLYHLDGIEQTRFLDMLLSLPKLNMIQWTQVAGQPGVIHNFHHLQRIQKAGKGIVLITSKRDLPAILNNLSAKGLRLIISDATDQQEADEIVEYVTKHSFKRELY